MPEQKLKAGIFPSPLVWINHYIANELNKYDDCGVKLNPNTGVIPFFLPTRSNLDMVYDQLLVDTGLNNPLYVDYERLFRMRPNPLYVHKREQALYYFRTGSADTLVNAINVVSRLLDREDVAAQELNKWMNEKQGSNLPVRDDSGNPLELNIFFRNMKVYQLDESRDLIELGSVKTMYSNKLIVEYDYHSKDSLYS